MKIQIPLEITIEHFESVIVTALEGGSNYWYCLAKEFDASELQLKNEALSMRIAYELFHNPNFKLKIMDIETDDYLGDVTQESMLKAFQDNPQKTLDIIDENYDAWTADILFQYAVMGEVMFG